MKRILSLCLVLVLCLSLLPVGALAEEVYYEYSMDFSVPNVCIILDESATQTVSYSFSSSPESEVTGFELKEVAYRGDEGDPKSIFSAEVDTEAQTVTLTGLSEGLAFAVFTFKNAKNEEISGAIHVEVLQSYQTTSGALETGAGWSLSGGVLTIAGKGAIPAQLTVSDIPWYPYRHQVREVHVGEGITDVGKSAFSGMTNLRKVELPSTLTCIAEDAFWECKSLTSLVIPKGVTSIGYGAFVRCGLTDITIPDTVTSIGTEAFSSCASLTSVTIPNSVTELGFNAFQHCTALTSATLSDSMTRLEPYTFSCCKNLRTVKLGKNTEYIGYSAFEGCGALTSLTLPDKVKEIDEWAFSGGLKSITLPASLTKIGSEVFQSRSLPALKQILYKGTKAQWQNITIYSLNDLLETLPIQCSDGDYTGGDDAAPLAIGNAKVTLSAKSYAYDGKAKKPTPTVKLGGRLLKKGTDYTVTYKNNKKIGTATVVIKGQGEYTGTVKATFKINPKAPTLSSVKNTAAKKATVKWKKVAGVTGYQIQYSTSKKFTAKTTKTVTVKGAAKVSKALTKLTKGKTYYVRVRTYQKVSGKTYYSAWSKVKTVKITR